MEDMKRSMALVAVILLLAVGIATPEEASNDSIVMTVTMVSSPPPPPMIGITRRMPKMVRTGQRFTVRLGLNNSGGPAFNITVTERIPAGYRPPWGWAWWIWPRPKEVNVSEEGNITILWMFNGLEPNATLTLRYMIKAPPPRNAGNYTFMADAIYFDQFGNQYTTTNIFEQEVKRRRRRWFWPWWWRW